MREPELAVYAAKSAISRGRVHAEPPPSFRSEFQRDRDRIIHATAFRRLVYKTQVFVNHEGDLYRTRLTHSLEVAQIARTAARELRLNEDLVEAISLAHDLGHTPFGHAGQDALNRCMRNFGGFEHNLQSLRVVDLLEERYVEFDGLNLTFESREGILKHCSERNARELGELGRRFIERRQPGLEAQLANVADEIAYNNHDVDDGLRSGLITIEALESIPFFAAQVASARARFPAAGEERISREAIRQMIGALVTDLVEASRARIEQAGLKSIDDVRALDSPLIGSSPELAQATLEIKHFLRENLYTHPHIRRMTESAHRTIERLFDAFINDLSLLPTEHAERARRAEGELGQSGSARIVADYIAGMTDRFALQTVEQLAAQ
jgi:dGTPase